MLQNIKRSLQYSLLAITAMVMVGVSSPLASTADAACKNSRVFTFPTWYNGMPGTCQEPKIEKLADIWIVVMNLVEIFLQVVAYVAAGYLIWGGFKYIKSEGDPSRISEAKSAIQNAVIGLVIAFGSVAIVEFIQGRIQG